MGDIKFIKKLINNYISKINKEYPIFRNIYYTHPKILNNDKKIKKKANCPRKIISEKSAIQKSLNHNFWNNIKLATSTTLLNNNIINKSIKLSKSVSNSKLIKKNYKRPNKRMNFIQINDKNKSSTKTILLLVKRRKVIQIIVVIIFIKLTKEKY